VDWLVFTGEEAGMVCIDCGAHVEQNRGSVSSLPVVKVTGGAETSPQLIHGCA